MQQPKTETDRLVNVLQVLQLGQKSGRLLVERGSGPQFEQGMIVFVNGRAVQASFNQLQGAEAFQQLRNWGSCRFTFLPGVPARSSSGPLWESAGARLPSTDSLPNTLPAQPGPGGRTTRDLGETDQSVSTAWLARPYRTRQLEEGMRLIEQMGLSRAHRRLFLLIDGSRTIKELMRLVSHNPADLLKLLRDLERAGVIHL